MQKQNLTNQIQDFERHKLQIIEEESLDEIACPHCQSTNFRKNGTDKRKTTRVQRYKCKSCNYDFTISGIAQRKKYQQNSISAEELGISLKHHYRSKSIGMDRIYQPWLRKEFERFIKFIAHRSEFSSIVNHTSHINRFSKFLLDRFPGITINEIDRSIIIEYLGTLKNFKNARNYIASLRLFLETGISNNWFEVPPYLITDDDYPKRLKSSPRYIPEEVMRQLNEHLDKLPEAIMRMVLVHQECGFRVSELVTLRLNCLQETPNGGYFILYTNWKLKKEDTKPISPALAKVIKEQQEYIAQHFKEFDYLFSDHEHYRDGKFGCAEYFIPKSKPMKKEKYTRFLKNLAHRYNITDSTGKIWNFQSHQFRHTVGTRMINNGVPQHIVQRYLGHESPEMTMVYAHIHDETLRKEIEKYHESIVVNFQGEIAELDETILSSNDDLEWFKKNVQARALEHGYCARPKLLGDCDIPGFDGCYNCPHWRTNKNFLPILKDTL
ncbi:tyrosine-type recombinase/integrase, partial [Fischerella sp. PCC 9605]|uniref:tyrosine-type recombinase/integrase n=1 Tax=Fischerella sp. PCC 9605 TaxID=1173024 RepID=UPI00054EC4B2